MLFIMRLLLPFSLFASALGSTQYESNMVHFPLELLHQLPAPFTTNNAYSFFNATQTSNSDVNDVLHTAANSPFIGLDPEFAQIMGYKDSNGSNSSQITLIEQRDDLFAYEGGIWVPETNEVWFYSLTIECPDHVHAVNLDNGTVRRLEFDPPLINLNGNTYLDGKVYVVTFQDNKTWPGGMYEVDPLTLKSAPVVNAYFGRKFHFPDDIVVSCPPNSSNGGPYLFFTDQGNLSLPYPGLEEARADQLVLRGAGVYRYDTASKKLARILDNLQVPHPNGIAISMDNKKLYVSNDPLAPPLSEPVTSSTIYRFDFLEDDYLAPVNQRIVAMSPTGGPDGFKIDDQGRLWTAEGEGIVVRSPKGDMLGIINGGYFGTEGWAIANFGLAGDTLIILGGQRLWSVKLGEVVRANPNAACGHQFP